MKVEKYKNSIIEDYGLDKYQETIDRIDDEDKVVLTRKEILPVFLEFAAQQISKTVSGLKHKYDMIPNFRKQFNDAFTREISKLKDTCQQHSSTEIGFRLSESPIL